MSKRKLTKQQAWRIEKIQAEKRERAAKKSAQLADTLNASELGPEQEGLLLARYGATVDVEASDGSLHYCHLRQNLQDLVPGDHVVWRAGPDDTGVVVASHPRDTSLARPDAQGQLKPIAANVNCIGIVIALQPAPTLDLIDRYLVAAELLNIQPIIILNKIDLINSRKHPLRQYLKLYTELGYHVFEISAQKLSSMKKLKKYFRAHTSVLVGQSGTGKSSIIAQLLPDIDISIGALSQGKSTQGTHTTSIARLYHLPDGGDLIDSPGVRSFRLWHAENTEILNGFIEFRPFIGQCKFRDCTHNHEPDCALRTAVEAGHISEYRFANYHKIVSER